MARAEQPIKEVGAPCRFNRLDWIISPNLHHRQPSVEFVQSQFGYNAEYESNVCWLALQVYCRLWRNKLLALFSTLCYESLCCRPSPVYHLFHLENWEVIELIRDDGDAYRNRVITNQIHQSNQIHGKCSRISFILLKN